MSSPKSPKKYNPFKKPKKITRQVSALEKSIISCNVYPYDRIITLNSEYGPGAKPKYKIPVVTSSKETMERPHDLIMFVPGDKGNNRFSMGNSICIGTFPDRASAKEKQKQLKAEFNGSGIKSPSELTNLGRPDWDMSKELIIKPSSIIHEDAKPIKTGKVTSRKNCDCPFRR